MFQPVLARTASVHQPVGPIAYDCVQLSFVRAGSACFFREFGQQRVREGDAVLLCPNTLWGSEPDDWITTTTVFIDKDFLVDQILWKHAAEFTDRLHTDECLAKCYLDRAQIIHLEVKRTSYMTPWLDELVAPSVEDADPRPLPQRLPVLPRLRLNGSSSPMPATATATSTPTSSAPGGTPSAPTVTVRPCS